MALNLDRRQRAMLQEMGVRVWLPEAAPVQPAATVAATPPPARQPVARPGSVPPPTATVQSIDSAATLDWPALAQSVAACKACPLSLGGGAGLLGGTPRRADWMVVGEPIDQAQAQAGQPFTGAAGQLLDNMLRAVQVSRHGEPLPAAQAAYVTNVVKCHPLPQRNPELHELARCETYLRRQVALVQPKIILALGHFASQCLLQESHSELLQEPLGRLRGTVYRYQGVALLVTYPPSYLLRSPQQKARVWEDLCLAKSLLQNS